MSDCDLCEAEDDEELDCLILWREVEHLRSRVAELEEENARLRAERAFLDDTLLKHRIYCDDGMGYESIEDWESCIQPEEGVYRLDYGASDLGIVWVAVRWHRDRNGDCDGSDISEHASEESAREWLAKEVEP